MRKLLIAALLLVSTNALAVKWAPINGSCEMDGEKVEVSFPSGVGSTFPEFKNGIRLSIFAGPSEGLVVDTNGLNLFDVTITAEAIKGKFLGTTIVRNLSSKPAVLRDFALDLYDGTILKCNF